MKRFTNRLSPATVIACIALFVSLGGVSYGVATGSIDSREIKNNTVRSKDIRNNDVRGKDIRTGAVGSSDLRNDGVRGIDVLESSLGKVPSAGSADSANSANAVEANGVSSGAIQNGAVTGGKLGQVVQHFSDIALAATNGNATNAECAAGEKLIGGGAQVLGTVADVALISSRPNNSVDGEEVTQWRGAAWNSTADPKTLRVFAVCLK